MDNDQKNLSASALRHHLIREIEGFIAALESRPLKDLQEMKLRIREVLALLHEKEKMETAPLHWGINSTEHAKIIPLTDKNEEPDLEENRDSDTLANGA